MRLMIKNILLVYPQFGKTYWGYQYMLDYIGKKALMPPLGLITIAAMVPDDYEIKLVDLNCEPLLPEHLVWADMVCLSAMLPQKTEMLKLAKQCRQAGKFVVAGGPYPSACPDECRDACDVLILDEGEVTWREFLNDLATGNLKTEYRTSEKPDLSSSPVPRYDLLNIDNYVYLTIQISRGCPFLCEFCDIIVMLGRKPRLKSGEQVLAELEAIYRTGYRGGIFIVDDNFIGNKKVIKQMLPKIQQWNDDYKKPFSFGTEASINLADDKVLMQAMVQADFVWVFIGIETPSEVGLKEIRKTQNTRCSLVDQVEIIQRHGLMVYGGFIIGFDSDDETIFQTQIDFIEQAAIPNVMIGPLVALPKTPLYERLEKTGRLVHSDADEARTVASGYTNIRTVMPNLLLLEGYKKILQTIYQPEAFFQRTLNVFARFPKDKQGQSLWNKIRQGNLSKIHRDKRSRLLSTWRALNNLRLLYQHMPVDFRRAAFKFSAKVIMRHPNQLHRLFAYILFAFHYYQFTNCHAIPSIEKFIETERLNPQMQIPVKTSATHSQIEVSIEFMDVN